MELAPVSDELLAKIERGLEEAKRQSLIPDGRVQTFDIRDGHLTRDGVPFFYIHWHTWTALADPASIEAARILSYYTLFNVFHCAGTGTQASRVEPGSVPDAFIADARLAYEMGFLITPRAGSEMLPYTEDFARDHPQELARNHRGQPYQRKMRSALPRDKDQPPRTTIGYVPRIGSQPHLERIRDCHASLAMWCRDHPAVLGAFAWEEMYYPKGGFAEAEIAMYRDWLRGRYGSIDALNAAWRTAYNDFDQIVPPTAEIENESKPLYGLRHAPDVFVLAKTEEKLELSGNGLNFQLFKLEDLTRRKALIYRTLKAIDPNHPVIGSKGPRGPQMWSRHQYVDISGECEILGPMVRPGIEAAGRVWQPATVNACEYWHYPSLGWPHYPFYRGPWQRYNSWEEDLYSIQSAPYAKIIREIFNGAKSLFVEDYSNMNAPHGGTEYHYIHHRRAYEQLQARDDCRGWGELPIDYTDEASKLPDVFVETKTLHLARAYQAAYRLAPLFLPGRVPAAEVAVLMSLESRYAPAAKWTFWEVVPALVDLLERIHVPCDVITNHNYSNEGLGRYRLLIIASPAILCDRPLADAVRRFVEEGGKVLYVPSGFSRELETLGRGQGPLPMHGLSELFGVEWDDLTEPSPEKNILLRDGGLLPGVSGQAELPCYTWPPQYAVGQIPWIGTLPPAREAHTGVLKPGPGSRVIGTVDDHPAVVVNASNTVISAIVPQLQIIDRLAHPWEAAWRSFFGGICEWAGVGVPVAVKQAPQSHLIDPGILVGDDYWLVGIANYAAGTQRFTVGLDFLPAGDFDVIDVTGERPLTQIDGSGHNHLSPDPAGRQARFVSRGTSSRDLASRGVTLEAVARGAVILLIRPAGRKVWLEMPARTLQQQLRRSGAVVVGDDAPQAEVELADALVRALGEAGVSARRARASSIGRTKVEFEVKAEGHILESFVNHPLRCEEDLVLIGTPGSNELIDHIEKSGTFAYDKVLHKVTADYPGPGRGIVQLLESINSAVYDSTDHCRRAVVISGSDATGLDAAVEMVLGELRPGARKA